MILFYLTFITSIYSSINIERDPAIEYCNYKGWDGSFPELSPYDLGRISSLEQVHIFARHGSRTGTIDFSQTFPNADQSLLKWRCNFTTTISRIYNNSNNFININKYFVKNEQQTEGNCPKDSTLFQSIIQYNKNANQFYKFYINNNKNSLFNYSEFNTLKKKIIDKSKIYADIDIDEIKILSTNYARCITSPIVFFTKLLNIDKSYNINFRLFTHDKERDPYSTQTSKGCKKLKLFINNHGHESRAYNEFINSNDYKIFEKKWYNMVGSNFDYSMSNSLIFAYCNGMELPIDWELFKWVEKTFYKVRSSIVHNKMSSILTSTLASMPMAWIIKTFIHDYIDYQLFKNDTKKYYLNAQKGKLFFHSTRGISTLYLMESLGISDGIQPPFGSMLNIEIYKKKDLIKPENMKTIYDNYLFRIVQWDNVLKYPDCGNIDNNEGNLCELSNLMKKLESQSMYIKEWEPYCDKITRKYFKKNKHKFGEELLINTDNSEDDEDESENNDNIVSLSDISKNIVNNKNKCDNNNGLGFAGIVAGFIFGALFIIIINKAPLIKNIIGGYKVVS